MYEDEKNLNPLEWRPDETFENYAPRDYSHPAPPECPHDKGKPFGRVPHDPAFMVPPIPPVHEHAHYMTPEQQIHELSHKMNKLIDVLNGYNKKVYGAYEHVVNAAMHNDAYYSEITIEDGYIGETSSPYKVIHIPFVDRASRPIFLELGLAYNNMTNTGVSEPSFDASARTIADKLIPATYTGMYGVGTWKYAPIPATEVMPIDEEFTRKVKWSVGVATNGFIKAYPEDNNTREIMNRDQIRNSMGVLSVMLRAGKPSPETYGDEEITARVGMGMNYKTKERFIVIVDDSPVPAQGCTVEQLGNIFAGYGCDVAVELANKTQVFGMDKGAFLYYPESGDSPVVPSVPNVSAFWYITKRRHYRNEYVREVAELMQRVNQNEWANYNANFTVDYLKNEVKRLSDSLEDEIAERGTADRQINQKIDDEIVTLNERIDQEVATLTAEDENIKNYFTVAIANEEAARKAADENEQNARDEADQNLRQDLTTETMEREGEDTELHNADIDRVRQIEDSEHVVTYTLLRKDASEVNQKIMTYEPEELKKRIVKEVKYTQDGTKDTYTLMDVEDRPIDRFIDTYNYDKLVSKLNSLDSVDADNAAAIQTEQQSRIAEDTRLSGRIDTNEGNITDLVHRMTVVEGQFGLSSEKNNEQDSRLSNLESSLSDLQNSTTQKLAEVDATVAAMQATVASTESSQESVKQAMASLQEEMNTYQETVNTTVNNLDTKLTEQIEKEQQDTEALATQLNLLAQNLNNAKGDIKANSDRITFVNNNLKAAMETKDKELEQSIEHNRDILQKIVDTLSDNMHALEETVNQIKDTVDNGNFPEIKDKLTELENKFSDYLPTAGGTMTGPITFERGE